MLSRRSNYISAVRARGLELNQPMPDRSDMPRLARLLHGYHNMHKEVKSGRIRLAITASILIDVLSKKLNREPEARAAGNVPSIYSLENYTLSAALYCSLFVGLHRPGELTVRRKHFTFRRTAVDNRISGATVSIPSTKTAQDGLRSVEETVCATSHLAEMWQDRVG